RQPHQRMAKVDDLLERRAKQVVLAIVARLAHRSPRQRISPSKESRTAPIGKPKSQEKPHAHPAFLQNRLLAQVKSSRSINRFRILHGRLSSAVSGQKSSIPELPLQCAPSLLPHRIGLAPTACCRSPGTLRKILDTTARPIDR